MLPRELSLDSSIVIQDIEFLCYCCLESPRCVLLPTTYGTPLEIDQQCLLWVFLLFLVYFWLPNGTARRSAEDTTNHVTYTLDVITLYKEEELGVDNDYGHNVSFVTDKNSDLLCGVTLEISEEYLIGLSWYSLGYFTASYCDLFREWSSVSDEDRASLEAGCEDDPCHEACGEYQVRYKCIAVGLVGTTPPPPPPPQNVGA